MNKKFYEKPELVQIEMNTVEIIVTSGPGVSTEPEKEPWTGDGDE